MTNAVVHWEIGGPNLPELRDFYAKAFGWTIDDAREDYCLVRPVADGTGGGLMQTRERMLPYVTIYIDVLDLDAALKTITGLGGDLLTPPTRINDSLSFALFQDPAGNAIGLLQGEPMTAA
ncbi:VOC family protein [Actinoplanes oblitus]|uniref:VOC family protein n=1 Tax=Actinoplanes oblitus TaxID=3040509 RepID=A0ABY8W4T3_9ACTN|nr:VOC family protein [Actinoplanes oblitus]WIM92859.1 VOC family protein [Actinoplanes oblitus]